MKERLEALQFYRYIQTALNTEGVDHLTVHIADDQQIEVIAVMVNHETCKKPRVH